MLSWSSVLLPQPLRVHAEKVWFVPVMKPGSDGVLVAAWRVLRSKVKSAGAARAPALRMERAVRAVKERYMVCFCL